jgi:general secretion pathway protein K
MPIVATLWSLTLLAAISVSLAFTGNIAYRLAQNSFHVAYDDALADAAVNLAVLALLDPRTDSRRLMNAVDQKLDLGGASIRIRIQDELGKIDLNQTDGSTLVKLFQSAGIDPAAAEALVDKILDWRENSPFKRVDPQFATPEVLAALPSLANAHAAAAGLLTGSTTAAPTSGISGNQISVLKGRAFTIDTEISRSTDVARHHSAIRLTGNPADPFWMLIRQRT